MTRWTPDPTFYPSPREAATAPAEKLAYVAAFDRPAGRPDAIVRARHRPRLADYGRVVGWTDMPYAGDELHHFGWNACSSALCPTAPHPHVERRYLIVPGLRSSRIHVLDTKPDPRQPEIVKVIEAGGAGERAGYSRPHTVHCGPDGIYVSALGGADGKGPGGIALLDHTTFDVRGPWEADRGPQYLAYDFWWHLGHDVLVTSEWGTPDHDRGRRRRRAAARPQVRPRASTSGTCAKRRHVQTGRPRRPVPDGAGAASGARPDARRTASSAW